LKFSTSFYDRDSSVPFWRANVDVDSLFAGHAHSPARAKAWLRFRDVSECSILEQAVMMRGNFEPGLLSDHTFHWTFTPTHVGALAIVLPVYEQHRFVDLLAISRHDHSIWGCLTGAGQYVGKFADSLAVYSAPYSWLMSNCDGVLPLAKAFYPLMQFAHSIVAQDGDHAWEIANQAFVYAAERFSLDSDAAEQAAFDRISFDEEAV
jgi:hypothetical protein